MAAMLRGTVPLVALLLVATSSTQEPAAPAREQRVAVVRIALATQDPIDTAFGAVADKAAAFHSATVIDWDGRDTKTLRALLADASVPTDILFVVRPERFHMMLHRSILLSLTDLDGDALLDATFGYLTARDDKTLDGLWQRTEALHRDGLRSRVWHSAGVTTGMRSTTYRGHRSELEKAAGFAGDSFYFGCVEDDPDVRTFVAATLPKLSAASVLTFGGNGDPQGIWLFEGKRNLKRELHWDYEPQRVGSDPDGAMPRLLADQVRAQALAGAIVWSGTCHSAATHLVWLEGDIVSTFGKAPHGTVHELPLEQSLGLAVLDAGACALLAPVGPNHGLAVLRETSFGLQHGASLGEILKSTYDDVLLAAKGPLRLDLAVDGKIQKNGEHVMQGGGANRVLLGDPTLRPFRATIDARETIRVEPATDGAFTVHVEWAAGFHARGWDMFGTDRERGASVPVRIAADTLLPASCAKVHVTVRGSLATGEELPLVLGHAVLEAFAGRRWLHLQANGPRKQVEGNALRVAFEVTPAKD